MLIKCVWGPTTTICPVTWQDFSQSSWRRRGWKKGAKFWGSLKLVEPGCIDSCGRFKPWASSWWIKCSWFHLCFKLWSGWGLWSLPKWASENWGNFPTYFHPLTGMFPQKQLFSPCGMGVTGPDRAMPRPFCETNLITHYVLSKKQERSTTWVPATVDS